MRFVYASPCCGMMVRCEAAPEAEAKKAGCASIHMGGCPACKSIVIVSVQPAALVQPATGIVPTPKGV